MSIFAHMKISALSAIIFLLVLTGCGGGGGGSTEVQVGGDTATGVFLDSAVEGLAYASGNTSGLTNASGQFAYEVGRTVRFTVGDIVIGETIGKRLITPVDLVAGGDADHPTVLNIARFLQTIDDDGNTSNGIRITEQVRALAQGRSVNFAQSVSDFSNDGNVQVIVSELTAATIAGARSLVSVDIARAHLSNTIWGYFAGAYSGTFGGGDSGTWNVQLLSNGSITGTGFSNNLGMTFTVSGTVRTDGTLTFAAGGTNTGATFSGRIADDFSVSGTWTNTGVAGTFSGRRTGELTAPDEDPGDGESPGGVGAIGTLTIASDGQVPSTLTPTKDFATINAPDSYLQAGWSQWINNDLWSVSFSSSAFSGASGTVVTFRRAMGTMYECKSGMFGLYGDCSGATFNYNLRTVTFSNVQLQAPGYGSVITLNGTLAY
jgi:hypothetical protein